MVVSVLDTNARVREELRSWAETTPAEAAAAATAWTDLLRREGFHFEGRAYPVGLLPLILYTNDVARFVDVSQRIISLLERSLRLFASEPRLQPLVCSPPRGRRVSGSLRRSATTCRARRRARRGSLGCSR